VGIRLIDMRAILLDPVDLRGLLTVGQGRAVWAIGRSRPAAENRHGSGHQEDR
jgi:hypothetical protein